MWKFAAVAALTGIGTIAALHSLPRAAAGAAQSECEVRNLLHESEVAEGTMAFTKGSKAPVEVKTLLRPLTLKTGNYALSLQRVTQNVYRDERSKYLVLTSVCNESGIGSQVVLRYTSAGGKMGSARLIFR